MPSVVNHVHTYVKLKKQKIRGRIGSSDILRDGEKMFKCDDPECTHIAPYSQVVGKKSICAVCHKEEIILDWRALERTRPRCIMCANTKEARDYKKGKALAAKYFNSLEETD
jgi:hypothetical protein